MRHQKGDITEGILSADGDDMVSVIAI